MGMDRDRALRKVLACLRLSASSEPHEAAAALRQARALMDKFGLTEADAAAAEIHHAEAATRCQGAKPPQSLCALTNVVADGYRCHAVVEVSITALWPKRTGTTRVRFYGAGSDAEVAAYAFTVLRRQLEAARAHHVRRVRKRANKAARGEAFALGWVSAIHRLFPREAIGDERTSAIEAAIRAHSGDVRTAKGREIAGRTQRGDEEAGFVAGLKAELRAGLAGSRQAQLTNQGEES